MNTITSKICVIGDFAVGKTSTVERFVNSAFSDKYLTTVGVKVDTKSVVSNEIDHKLIIWDIAGTDRFGEIEFSYLRGSAGYILVADGTRFNTIAAAQDLRAQVEARYGELPYVFLINKSDLSQEWEVTDQSMESLRSSCKNVYTTSAKTGEDVENALFKLAKLILDRDFS